MIDIDAIEKNIRQILIALGENPDRPGLIDTPKRAALMYQEVFEGIGYSNQQIAEQLGKTFDDDISFEPISNDMVVMKDIDFFSYCEHHMALMYNMTATVAYLPKGKVIGLSKIARIVEMVGKRLQLQEKIGTDIAQIMSLVTDSPDIAVIIQAEHSCMTSRGIKKNHAPTMTTTFKGAFQTDENLVKRLLFLTGQV